MANEKSYQYTATPVAYGPSGELIPSFEPYLGRYKSVEEIDAHYGLMGELPQVEAGSINVGQSATLAIGIFAGFLAAALLTKGK